ncbi:uncharacterized protein (DUF1697 family) [Novosphingobium sp. PhB165]|uniref:DUF1697 domain-containing protein n=1 Tax=Novosphingobium sp. PhB165 TaxID=2485105 RepID=UPI00104FF627|nr:DUF1697 domain-containing protein [Novosphingobium sp. PhB165]TCM17924.1 uncharacterized protein (DUF1697 family) [Novosphingobium sp. PhB165]
MTRYCAFFASINVGGNRLTMADLRYALEREDIANVETVIASGNVLFDYDDRPTEGLEELFEYVMRERFDMQTFAAVRNRAEVLAAVEQNPFVGGSEDKFVHTFLLERQPTQAQFDKLVADYAGRGDETLALGPRSLYVDFVHGVAESRLTSAFIERKLGCRGTARNVRSLARIVAKM